MEVALAFYDTLDPLDVADMTGSWQGEGMNTGHAFDGVLDRFGWQGKRFDGPDEAHPLVVHSGSGRRMSIDPAFVPQVLLTRPALLRAPLAPVLFSAARPILSTRKPKARLRHMEYRGVVTATMCYDALPIHDAFRGVDADTVVGAMDLRGFRRPFLFVLRRESPLVPPAQ